MSRARVQGGASEPSPVKAPEKKTFSLVQSSDIKVRRPLAPTRPVPRPTSALEAPQNEPVRLPPAPVTTDAKPKRNRAGLSQRELAQYRDLLLAKRRELLGDMSSMEREALRSQGSNLSNLPVHMADMGTDNYEQEFTLGLVEKDRVLLREIHVALGKIQDGTYARNWILENQVGRPSFLAMRRAERNHPIEVVGRKLRSMMSWLKPKVVF